MKIGLYPCSQSTPYPLAHWLVLMSMERSIPGTPITPFDDTGVGPFSLLQEESFPMLPKWSISNYFFPLTKSINAFVDKSLKEAVEIGEKVAIVIVLKHLKFNQV